MEYTVSPKVRPYLLIGVAIAAISTGSILIRYAQGDAPALVIAAYRLSFATLIITPLTFARHRAALHSLTRRDLGWAVASGLFLSVHFATWVSSLDYTTVMASVVLVTTSPLWVALASALLMRTHLSWGMRAGLGVTLGGSVLIALGGDAGSGRASAPLWGNFLALVGAWTIAGYWMIGRHLRARLSMLLYTWLVYGTAAVLMWAAVLVDGLPVAGYRGRVYVLFVLMALLPQLLGHSLFNYALAQLSAVYVSVAALGEPVGATILAALLLGEVPTLLQVAGGGLILGGIFITSLEEQAKARVAGRAV